MTSTNPFDDSPSSPLSTPRTVSNNNPFDDSQQPDVSHETISDDEASNSAIRMNGDIMGDVSRYEESDLECSSSWQFLGDLPYRVVPVFEDVNWNGNSDTDDEESQLFDNGLTKFPSSWLLSQRRSSSLSDEELSRLLIKSTVTKVAGCPHGGPIAAVTVPLDGTGGANMMKVTYIRIMSNSGRLLSCVEFPPSDLGDVDTGGSGRTYGAADILTIAFTDRMKLLVILRDSLTLIYNLKGELLIPPFLILPPNIGAVNVTFPEVFLVGNYDGGVAVISESMHCALLEVMDQHDDPTYIDNANLQARKVTGESNGDDDNNKNNDNNDYVIITPLPTAQYAQIHNMSFSSLAVLSKVHTSSRHPEIFIGTSSRSVLIIDSLSGQITDVECSNRLPSPVTQMSFAPNGRFLACFTATNVLTVLSTNFETKVLDFDTSDGSPSPPLVMEWCGEDSVVLHYPQLGILLVGPYGDWLRIPFDTCHHRLYVLPELDCCRIFTSNSVEIIQRVPPQSVALLSIGSIEPPALLLDASDAFESGSPASDEAARAVSKTGLLKEAIESCAKAATGEFNVTLQKRLLRAASYGTHFYCKTKNDIVVGGGDRPTETTTIFVDCAKKLRVLNVLRDKSVGWPLTASQFDALGAEGVVARLIDMRSPALAAKISVYLGLNEDCKAHARASRASAFVATQKNTSASQIVEEAVNILRENLKDKYTTNTASYRVKKDYRNQGSYALVALAAKESGRLDVATLILRLETSIQAKIPALLKMKCFADAAAVSLDFKDSNFMFLTLMEFQKSCDAANNQQQFLNAMVSKFPKEVNNLLKKYYSCLQDTKPLMNLYIRGQNFTEAGLLTAKRAINKHNSDRERQALLKEASNVFGLGKDCSFLKSCTDEYYELISEQERLHKTLTFTSFTPNTSSISSTLDALLRLASQHPRETHKIFLETDKFVKRMRVPEKRVWYIKVRAMSETDQWSLLRNLSESRTKSPIGYSPFAVAAIRRKQPVKEILRYVERVGTGEDRFDLFVRAELWKRALEEAVKLKDTGRIGHVKSMCDLEDIRTLCDELMKG